RKVLVLREKASRKLLISTSLFQLWGCSSWSNGRVYWIRFTTRIVNSRHTYIPFNV
ncbi:hypothetical protein RYX36_016781, partial [Vicia faba]